MTPEILATVFAGSLLGSLHCVGMCGGFVAFYSGTDGSSSGARRLAPHLAYNGGRLLTYVLLGLVAGAVGAAVNFAGAGTGVPQIAAIVAGSVIVLWGLALLLQATTRFRLPTPRWLDRLLSKVLPSLRSKPPVIRGLVLGMSSTLLPCGWLYGFAVTAAGTGSAVNGALVMAAFWLGTVPAMLGMGLGVHKLARLVGPRLPVLMPIMLMAIGIATIASRSAMTHMHDHHGPSSAVEHHHAQP